MFFGHTHKDLNHLHFLSYFLNSHNEPFGEAGVYWEAEAAVWWIKELDASGWYRGDGLSRDGFNRPASDGCTPAGLHENTLQTLLFGTHSWSEIALNHFTTNVTVKSDDMHWKWTIKFLFLSKTQRFRLKITHHSPEDSSRTIWSSWK